jgi:hypothetical protein
MDAYQEVSAFDKDALTLFSATPRGYSATHQVNSERTRINEVIKAANLEGISYGLC